MLPISASTDKCRSVMFSIYVVPMRCIMYGQHGVCWLLGCPDEGESPTDSVLDTYVYDASTGMTLAKTQPSRENPRFTVGARNLVFVTNGLAGRLSSSFWGATILVQNKCVLVLSESIVLSYSRRTEEWHGWRKEWRLG